MQKILLICLVAIVLLFQYQLYYGHDGYVDDSKLKNRLTQQIITNKALSRRNASMVAKITDLRGSDALLEARARSELNLIRPNEKLVVLPGNPLMPNINKK